MKILTNTKHAFLAFSALGLFVLQSQAVVSIAPTIVGGPSLDTFTTLGEFNTDGDFEGYSIGGSISNEAVAGGVLSATIDGPNGHFFGDTPSLNLDSGNFDYLEFKMNSSASGSFVFFFGDGVENFSSAKRFNISGIVASDNTYLVHLGSDTSWAGNLGEVRLQPLNKSDETISIDYVRVGTIPEPSHYATISALIVASCSLLIRRRKA